MMIFVFYPPEKGDEGGFVLLEEDNRWVWYFFPSWGVVRSNGVDVLYVQDILTRLQI